METYYARWKWSPAKFYALLDEGMKELEISNRLMGDTFEVSADTVDRWRRSLSSPSMLVQKQVVKILDRFKLDLK